jgi:hypothetical protein
VPRESAKRIQTDAQRAALDLLRQRTEGIGDAAPPGHRLTEQQAESTDTIAEYTATIRKLRDSGWTLDELNHLGLPDLTTSPKNRRTTRAATTTAIRPAVSEPATPSAPDTPTYGGH